MTKRPLVLVDTDKYRPSRGPEPVQVGALAEL